MLNLDQIVALDLTSPLEEAGIPHCVVGSVASSLYGMPRTTMDVDVLLVLRLDKLQRAVSLWEGKFFVDDHQIRDAILQKTSFNIFHRESMVRADCYIAKDDAYTHEQLARRRKITLPPNDWYLWVASPEDTVLYKLYWYELGERVSERQWADALSVLSVSHQELDLDYMRQWAAWLKVVPLLEKALKESAVKP